ncbi:unnamed protein product [Pneumocystis jirovecii]|uniref:Uncharacterized protein n=1 Tax=Pneumocystis jirovecii TaxID=42068 RepID=L0PGG2_PNEJI|nr:unnamed protein product [Pneumocystis jirovecii]
MGEQDFDEFQSDLKQINGYPQRHVPVVNILLTNYQLPWYSAPDKPFPRRKYKCLKCEEIQKQLFNNQAQTAPVSEKKTQIETLVESNEISPLNQVLVDEEVLESDVSVPQSRTAPRSWSDLLKGHGSSYAAVLPSKSVSPIASDTVVNGLNQALDAIKLSPEKKHYVLQPRGLINTGNILQVLAFCPPFYNLLDEISKKMVNSSVNDVSLINALISFIREFSVITQPVLNGTSQAKKQTSRTLENLLFQNMFI